MTNNLEFDTRPSFVKATDSEKKNKQLQKNRNPNPYRNGGDKKFAIWIIDTTTTTYTLTLPNIVSQKYFPWIINIIAV